MHGTTYLIGLSVNLCLQKTIVSMNKFFFGDFSGSSCIWPL